MRTASAGGVRSAFTLLEILIVAVVIATLATASVPTLAALLGRGPFLSTTAEVRSALTSARHQAVTSGQPRWIRCEADGYRLLAGFDGQPADTLLELNEEVRFEVEEPEPVTRETVEELDSSLADESWSPPCVFLPDGSATDAAWTVTLGTRSRVLAVRSVSGGIDVRGVEE